MRRRGERAAWLRDATLGAMGGLFASWVMGAAQASINKLGDQRTLRRERIAGESAGGSATEKLAARVARPFGVLLNERQRQTGGQIVHYAYGAAWGAAFGLLARRIALPPIAAGCAFGASLWLISDEVLVPIFKLSPPPPRFPLSTHGKALAAHVIYGAVADGSFRALGSALRAAR